MYCYYKITDDCPKLLNEIYSLFKYFYINCLYEDIRKSVENLKDNTKYICNNFYELVKSLSVKPKKERVKMTQDIIIDWSNIKNSANIRYRLLYHIYFIINKLDHTIDPQIVKIMKEHEMMEWEEIIPHYKLKETIFGLIIMFIDNILN